MIDLDRLYTEDEASEIINRAPSTMQKDRCAGRGVPFVKQGRSVRYRGRDILKEIEQLPTFRSTAEASAAGGRKPARRGRPARAEAAAAE